MEALQSESCIKLPPLAREAHPHQYHGNMSMKSREESIEEFQNDPEKVIMIASLKCGGIGLVRQSLIVKTPKIDNPGRI